MDSDDIIRLGEVLATQAEIEGMKVENLKREQDDLAAAYSNVDFANKAEEIRNVIYAPKIY